MSSGVLIFFDFRALEPFAKVDHDHHRSGLMDGFDSRRNFVGIGWAFGTIKDMVGDGGCHHIHSRPFFSFPSLGGRLVVDVAGMM